MDPLQGNEAIQQLMKLLEENERQGQAADLSALLWYMDGMNRQYEAVLQELQAVRQELSGEREPAVKYVARIAASELEHKAGQVKELLGGLREKIARCAADAVRDFKELGTLALDRTVSALGAKSILEALRENISGMIDDMKQSIEAVENIGHELRSAGAHLKNAGRVATGKEAQAVDGGQEGRFQSAALAPMRATQKLLVGMNNATLAAIGNVERLEEVAVDTREAQAERSARKPGKRLEKRSSVRQELAAKRAAVNAAAPDRAHKSPEAAR